MRRVAALLLAGTLVSCGGGGESVDNNNSGDTIFPTVSITSPASAATVSGTVKVAANASDNTGVAGVQFQLDGANVGIEDTTEPYSADWNTMAGSNSLHTLTASARDTAGNRTTSAPVSVTLSNPVQPPLAGRVEETNASVKLSPGWTQSNPDWFAWSGGAAVESKAPGALATLTFTGPSVMWIGNRNVSSGIALVKVDGVLVSEVDLFARSEEVHTPIITVNGLSSGTHTLTIQVADHRNPEALSNLVVVDAFDVPARVVSHLQETDPDVFFTADWVQADRNIAWSGGGATTIPDPPVGGARVSDKPGAKVTLTFRGTAVSWSGARRPGTGIAIVSVDGGVATEVDTYSPTNKIQDIVFMKTGLADAPHTLTIEATGRQSGFSTGAEIVVDAFDVITPGKRFQERDAAVAYTGAWIHGNVNRTWSEGTISESNVPGAKVTFTFTGTSVSWIGCRKLTTGMAKVYLDGVFVKDIDTYLPPPMEAYQTTIFRNDALAPGPHELTIEAISGGYVVVDAFDVRP